MMQPMPIEILGAVLFACAVLHTFLVGRILDFSRRFPKGSPTESILHFLGEIEVVFGVWGAFLLILMGVSQGFGSVVEYQNRLHFTEPIFVFCIMVIAATKPVLWLAQKLIQSISALLAKATRVPQTLMDIFVLLVLGPLSGSLITEPAAMTVTALLLARMVHKVDAKLMYALLAVLFVNVSIGGALTPYAAPPILMVAQKWGWDLATVFGYFGWKAAGAVIVNSLCLTFYFKKILQTHVQPLRKVSDAEQIPVGVILLHYGFLVVLVLCAHYPALAMGVFLFFLGMTTVTKKYQDRIRLKEALLVAFFLAGIIVFGPLQAWWLTPLLQSMGQTTLFLGATALTAITDNAALTFLGSQVEGLSESSKYYLVAGAIAGGGLTIIANAPNAAGFSILQDKFQGGVHPGRLLMAAILPTLVALLFLSFLPG
ncbi:MAG: putative Na+/H+ antiporter [Bdellovibrio sp.]|jgi:hypothetical protein